MTNNPIVHIENLSVFYGDAQILEDINLDVQKGDFLGIIGPNGSGKTTLLKTILGLIKPTDGTLLLFGQPIQSFRDWQKIGYVPQKAGAELIRFPLTVHEAVSLGRLNGKRFFDFENQKDSRVIEEALEAVGMQDHSNRLLRELSGGQQQRVFIAKALASRPELLVLDEPTVGVDVDSQSTFYDLLQRLNKKMDLTLILVSHDIDVVAHEVTSVACINRTIVSHGKPKDVLKENVIKKLYGAHAKLVVHGH